MPAAAVASFTPAITGMSGTLVGASGEAAVDMGGALSTKKIRHGRIYPGHPRLLSLNESSRRRWPGHRARRCASRFSPAMTVVNTIGFAEVTANSYFFAGAILESAGLAGSVLASVLVSDLAVSAGLSMRSTLAASRSLPT